MKHYENKGQRFMKCMKCGTVHIVVNNVWDDYPSCKKCNSTNFIPVNKGIPGYMPTFCDQYLDKEIQDGVFSSLLSPLNTWKKEIDEKYKINLSKNDLQDLANSLSILGKAMVNTTRKSFIEDNFVRKLKGQFKSYLYSKQKITKKNHDK